jgi:hypothetical protein
MKDCQFINESNVLNLFNITKAMLDLIKEDKKKEEFVENEELSM